MGKEAVLRGEVGVCILAGGQASRLNYRGTLPKGCLVLPYLPSQKSLFQVLAEKVQRAETLALQHARRTTHSLSLRCPRIPVIILTSQENHQSTVEYFNLNHGFGLHASQLFFIRQDMLPVFRLDASSEPHLIFKTRTEVAFAPTGNGSFYRAFGESGLCRRLKNSGINYLHICAVDNVLTYVADPTFIGWCIDQGLDVGCKGFAEPVKDFKKQAGIFSYDQTTESDNKWSVCEYFDLTPEMAARMDDPWFSDASVIANVGEYCVSMEFCEEEWKREQENPKQPSRWHVAKKVCPTCQNSDGKVDCIKLESLIFDAFSDARKTGVFCVRAEEQFAPIKYPDPPLERTMDFAVVAEAHPFTPIAARVALLRNDIRQVSGAELDIASTVPIDKLSFEVDHLLPVWRPADILRLDSDEDDDLAE